MPSVKDFEKNQGHQSSKESQETKSDQHKSEEHEQKLHASGKKRRPGREGQMHSETKIEVKVVEVENQNTQAEMKQTQTAQGSPTGSANGNEQSPETDRKTVEINFAGSELLRTKFPKSFKFAEAVATEWVNDGQFEALPVNQPLVQFLSQRSLRKAKDLEKKVLTSPVTEKVTMQAFSAAMKGQQAVNELKSKVEKMKDKILKK